MTNSLTDHILYINLAYREDRKRYILDNLKKYGFKDESIHRIDAVLTEQCGHIGCGLSHIKALEYALEHNFDSVMIFEDDFMFTTDVAYVHETLDKIEPLQWDVVLLAKGLRVNLKNSDHSFLKRIVHCTTTSGYIVRKHYYQTLIDNFKESVKKIRLQLKIHIDKCKIANVPITKLQNCSTIDVHWWSLQKRDTFYLCDPVLGKQDQSYYSDNTCSIEHQRDKLKMLPESQPKIEIPEVKIPETTASEAIVNITTQQPQLKPQIKPRTKYQTSRVPIIPVRDPKKQPNDFMSYLIAKHKKNKLQS